MKSLLSLLLAATSTFAAEIKAVGQADVSAWPDHALLSIVTQSVKPRLKDALLESRTTIVQASGIARRHVAADSCLAATQTFTDRETQWDNRTQQEKFLGFSATQTFQVRLDSLERISEFVDEILKLPRTRIAWVEFRVTAEDSLQRAAAVAAVANAHQTAMAMARSQGLGSVKLREATNYLELKKPDRWELDSRPGVRTGISVLGKGIGAQGISFNPELVVFESRAHVVLDAQ